MSEVCISAMFLNIVISSGKFVNLLNLLLILKPLPSGASSSADTTSPKFEAQASNCCIPLSNSCCFCKNCCIINISVIELLTGVPVAKTIFLPPFCELIYSHFICMSNTFFAELPDIPATFLIFVNIPPFL